MIEELIVHSMNRIFGRFDYEVEQEIDRKVERLCKARGIIWTNTFGSVNRQVRQAIWWPMRHSSSSLVTEERKIWKE